MSMRMRSILAGVAILVVALLWFLLLWQPRQNRIGELQDQQDAVRRETAGLNTRLQRLQQLQVDAPRLQAELARLQDALPSDPRLPDFILQVQQSASLAGIEFLSITPGLPAPFTPPATATPDASGAPPPAGLLAISVSVATTGKYFALEDYIVRMERLPRAVRIDSFGFSPSASEVPGSSPDLSVTFSMQMFMQGPGAPGAPADAGAGAVDPQATASGDGDARGAVAARAGRGEQDGRG